MKELKCLLVGNDCWKKYHGTTYAPSGIGVHTTDKAGRVLKRFVQPAENQTDGMAISGRPATRSEMLIELGKNQYGNDWNRPGVEACVHAFLGETADGSLAVCQTLDYTEPCWGSGSGPKGSYNGCYKGVATPPLYIQFEMIEDASGDPAYATRLYKLGVEFCARLMLSFPTIHLPDVIGHHEAYLRGMGSEHGDPETYWRRCGLSLTMDTFRKDVQETYNDLKEFGMTREELEKLIDKRATEIADVKLAAVAVALNHENEKPNTKPELLAGSVQDYVSKALLAALGPWIGDINDVPWESVKPELRRLLDCGAINGGTDDNPDDINMPLEILRSVLISTRYTDAVNDQK